MNGASANENPHGHGNMKCTFEITVRYMQNATWQGSIHWADTDRTQFFRSELEMLALMEEALADTGFDPGLLNWQAE